MYSHETGSLVCNSDKILALSIIARRKEGRGGGKWNRRRQCELLLLREKVKDDGVAKLCVYPCFSPCIPLSPSICLMERRLRAEGGRAWDVEHDLGGGGRRGEKKNGAKVCWPSCVLAISSRRLVGIGQVRVSLSTWYAVQLCLYIAQAQFGTCIGYTYTKKNECTCHTAKQTSKQALKQVQWISALSQNCVFQGRWNHHKYNYTRLSYELDVVLKNQHWRSS